MDGWMDECYVDECWGDDGWVDEWWIKVGYVCTHVLIILPHKAHCLSTTVHFSCFVSLELDKDLSQRTRPCVCPLSTVHRVSCLDACPSTACIQAPLPAYALWPRGPWFHHIHRGPCASHCPPCQDNAEDMCTKQVMAPSSGSGYSCMIKSGQRPWQKRKSSLWWGFPKGRSRHSSGH